MATPNNANTPQAPTPAGAATPPVAQEEAAAGQVNAGEQEATASLVEVKTRPHPNGSVSLIPRTEPADAEGTFNFYIKESEGNWPSIFQRFVGREFTVPKRFIVPGETREFSAEFIDRQGNLGGSKTVTARFPAAQAQGGNQGQSNQQQQRGGNQNRNQTVGGQQGQGQGQQAGTQQQAAPAYRPTPTASVTTVAAVQLPKVVIAEVVVGEGFAYLIIDHSMEYVSYQGIRLDKQQPVVIGSCEEADTLLPLQDLEFEKKYNVAVRGITPNGDKGPISKIKEVRIPRPAAQAAPGNTAPAALTTAALAQAEEALPSVTGLGLSDLGNGQVKARCNKARIGTHPVLYRFDVTPSTGGTIPHFSSDPEVTFGSAPGTEIEVTGSAGIEGTGKFGPASTPRSITPERPTPPSLPEEEKEGKKKEEEKEEESPQDKARREQLEKEAAEKKAREEKQALTNKIVIGGLILLGICLAIWALAKNGVFGSSAQIDPNAGVINAVGHQTTVLSGMLGRMSDDNRQGFASLTTNQQQLAREARESLTPVVAAITNLSQLISTPRPTPAPASLPPQNHSVNLYVDREALFGIPSVTSVETVTVILAPGETKSYDVPDHKDLNINASTTVRVSPPPVADGHIPSPHVTLHNPGPQSEVIYLTWKNKP